MDDTISNERERRMYFPSKKYLQHIFKAILFLATHVAYAAGKNNISPAMVADTICAMIFLLV